MDGWRSKCQLLNSLRWPIYVINSVDNTKLRHSNEVSAYFVLIMFLHVFSRGIVENKYATKNYEIFHFSHAFPLYIHSLRGSWVYRLIMSDSGKIPLPREFPPSYSYGIRYTIRKCCTTSVNNGPQRALWSAEVDSKRRLVPLNLVEATCIAEQEVPCHIQGSSTILY